MEINTNILEILKESSIFVEEYYILYCKWNKENWLLKYKPKDFSYNKLIALGFLTNTRDLSAKGSDLMNRIFQNKSNNSINQELLDEQFDKFFAAFPSSDAYRHWEKGRSFKIGERKAKILFANILAEGKYTADDLIRALELEIAMRKRRSIKENQFQYMKGVVNWLKDRVFEATLQLDQETTSSEDDVGYQKSIV